MAAQQKLQILDGPSKWDLMLSLFDGDCANRRRVIFKMKYPYLEAYSLPVVIHQLEREDGNGERWNFLGYCHAGRRVKGFFSTQKRTGWLETMPEA